MLSRSHFGLTGRRYATTGFTLIELLVVIAIIAILAAILFPVFASAREKARQSACLSNLKQVSLAILQYNQDYDEAFPCGDLASGYVSGRGWAARVYPYVKNTGVLRCPDDPTEDATGLNGQPGEVDTTVSYGFNSNLDGRTHALPSLNRPASTVLLFEVQGAHQWLSAPNGDDSSAFYHASSVGAQGGDSNGPGYIDLAWNGSSNPKPQYATGTPGQPAASLASWVVDATQGRHSGGSNVGLADGHSKFLLRQTLSNGYEALDSKNDQTTYYAAGSDFVGSAPKNFVATFSPR